MNFNEYSFFFSINRLFHISRLVQIIDVRLFTTNIVQFCAFSPTAKRKVHLNTTNLTSYMTKTLSNFPLHINKQHLVKAKGHAKQRKAAILFSIYTDNTNTYITTHVNIWYE